MQYKTHIATTFVVAIPIISLTDTMTAGTVIAVSLGALLPDIDEPRSYVGSRTRGISDLFSAIFGHRGITHSLLFLGIISILALIIHFFRMISLMSAYFVAFGYLMHLVEDSFSKSGIAWFQPFSKKQYKSGFEKYIM